MRRADCQPKEVATSDASDTCLSLAFISFILQGGVLGIQERMKRVQYASSGDIHTFVLRRLLLCNFGVMSYHTCSPT
ncbi:Protein of unknown function [Pyronema omphalodes CBS 100304]|uniref:Uncharacterized protein n=1 Tax=Pyronema omphalodes (strain CBS 100304) TaxID=1076935 RepID=U4LDA2_PYROM|nr:Protein of unknown function [Pyronema omphalodes CBS 100304]